MRRSLSCVLSTTAVVFVGIGSAAVSAQPVFGGCCRTIEVAVAVAPRAIAAADLNRDGWTDLILAGTAPGRVTVLLHHGLEDGDEGQRFQAPANYDVGGGPFDIAVGDLNRDGWPDVAVANADANAVNLLFGIGHGDLSAPLVIPVADNPRGIAIGDFNRDSIPDLVVTKFTATTVDVLYGAGDGTFPRRVSPPAPSAQAGAQGVTTGDFDNDGWGDFAVASTAGTIRIYKMFPTGTVVVDLNPAGAGWNVIAASDLDRDGRQDLAVASTGSSVMEVLYNRAAGWAASPLIPVAASPRGIAIADLDRNGTGEIVVAGRAASAVTVITRGATGTFSTADVPAGSGARTIALADIDGDGKIDIATANEFARSVTLLSNMTQAPAGAFAFDVVRLPWLSDSSVFGVADFNHNGKPDIVRASHVYFDDGTQSRYLGTAPNQNENPGGAVGDFNRDGHPDVAYAAFDQVKVFFGTGTTQFTDGPAMQIPGAFRLRVADFNRDGRPDLVVQYGGYGVPPGFDCFMATGDGTFARGIRLSGTWNAVETADVDRDDIVDIVATGAGGIRTFLSDGTGGLKATRVSDAGVQRFGLALGDLTGDGILDLAAVDSFTYNWGGVTPWSTFSVLRGVGDGTFEHFGQYDTAAPDGSDFHVLYNLLIGDVNGDGVNDVFTSHGELYPGVGLQAPLLEPVRFEADGFRDMLLADVNGDGLNDVLGFTYYGSGDYGPVIVVNTTRTENRPPSGLSISGSVTWPYDRYWWDTDENEINAGRVTDPDLHKVRYRWTLADGTVVGVYQGWTPHLNPGSYQVTVTADDYRGASISRTFTLDVPPFQEMVLTPGYDARVYGAWQSVQDPTAVDGYRVWHPDAGAAKLAAPLANPTNFFEINFLADPTQEYKLWIRMKADSDYWGNDSVFVQFTGAKDAAGRPIYEIGTTSALAVNLEECSGCGVSGWGWEDDAWGAVNANGTTLRFPDGGPQTLRVQTREDGVSIDQIVLSAVKYRSARPGTAKNDHTLLPRTGPYLYTPPR
jgi:FG-GAP-like repeat